MAVVAKSLVAYAIKDMGEVVQVWLRVNDLECARIELLVFLKQWLNCGVFLGIKY